MAQETRSKSEIVAALSLEDRAKVFAGFTPEEIDALIYNADFWLRPAQMIEDGSWFITALICGRGWGKTRTISEWVRRKALSMPGVRIGLAGKNSADVRDVIVEGPSGLLAVHHPDERPEYNPSIRRITWKNGSVATLLSSEAPDQGRGPGYHYVVMDEFAAWKEIRDDSGATLFTNLIAATRESMNGSKPQLLIATTPKRTATMRKIIADHHDNPNRVRIINGKTSDNKSLTESYIKDFEQQYTDNPNLYKQEILGLMIEDEEGLVFTSKMIEDNRITYQAVPPRRQYPLRVVAVDPTVAAEPRDECGIVVIGATVDRTPADRRAVVLADESIKAAPDVWAKRVVDTCKDWGTKFVIIEKNQGGDLLRSTIHAIDPSLQIFTVTATKGKMLRAEPVVVAMQQGRVKFWGVYPELEDQMNFYDPAQKGYSPDRLDAFVWGIVSTIITPPVGLYTATSSIYKPTGILPVSRVGTGPRSHELQARGR